MNYTPATAPSIDARGAWLGDEAECRKLYRQYAGHFNGSFAAIRVYYGWTRPAMAVALRKGKP